MIKLKQLQFSYPKNHDYNNNNNQTTIAANLSLPDLHLNAGEKVAVVGASGSGKSTLLNLIAGFLIAEQGSIILNGNNHTKTKPHQRPVSMLFQDNNLFNHLSVEQNLILGLQPRLKIAANQHQQIKSIAEKVGLAAYLSRYPDKLSGGQKQRVALARCLLRNQPILLLDEPFSALDKALRREMLALLAEICSEKNLTVMMVTHQPEELQGFVDTMVTIADNTVQIS